MRTGRFFWKLFLGNAGLLAIALGVSVYLTIREFDRFHESELTPYLFQLAESLRLQTENRFDDSHASELASIARTIGSNQADRVRITFVGADGQVLADSDADPRAMEPHNDRPEIIEALRMGIGERTRWSTTVSRTMKYVAVRVGPEDRPVGVVRVAMGVRTLGERTRSLYTLLGPIGAIGFLASIGLAVGLAVLWSGRIRRITATAQRLSRGDLHSPIDVKGQDEVAMLARSLDRMRSRLAAQIETIDRQRKSLDSLIGQLTEGVVVADESGRISLMNPAAARFLGLDGHRIGPHNDAHPTIEQCIPQHDLQELLLPCRADGKTTATESIQPSIFKEARLTLAHSNGIVHLLARACNISLSSPRFGGLTGEADATSHEGRLLVLTDVSDLTKAVRMRSDFVANASHELRTPLSAIRAAVETLMRLNPLEEPDAVKRFLGIVSRQSAHLEAMVTDLLDLSRVESQSARFEMVAMYVQQTVDELKGRWEESLQQHGIRWRSEVAQDCSTVQANPHLLKLVLDNLVDNAIKFTNSGGEIAVTCRCGDDHVIIEVADSGCGIAREHLERVFERFFQVASDRSQTGSPAGERRGTGLGLSIVRHAVLAMGGTVRLESERGVGTQVFVKLQRKARE